MRTKYVLFALVLIAPRTAPAVVTAYSNESVWQTAVGTFVFEGFDDQPSFLNYGTNTNTFTTGLQVTSDSGNLNTVPIGFGNSVGGSSPTLLTDDASWGQDTEFTFDLPFTSSAAGLLIIDHEDGSNPEWLNFYNGNTLVHQIQPLPFDPNGPPTANTPAYFVGITSTSTPITRMVIHFAGTTSGFGDSIALDNVQWAVPEPMTFVLLGTAGLIFLPRRRGAGGSLQIRSSTEVNGKEAQS